jgi:soluble lytic murein transglycosylase
MYLDMRSEAALELRALQDLVPGRSGAQIGVSKAFFELGDYYSSLTIILRNFDRALERPSERLPADLWLLAYPQGFWQSVVSASRKYGMDPYFVAAIIREESQFRPEAVSPAGARGVMQVMPTTGEWIARNAGIAGFDRARLFEADMNITVGTWYLSHLMKRFQGDLYRVSAAYNAGPEAVAAWTGSGDTAAFVETIPYMETRGYVKKVLRNYAEYRRLYAGTGASALLSAPAGTAARSVSAGTMVCQATGTCSSPSGGR